MHAGMKFMCPGNAKPILIQRIGMLRPPHKRPHLRNLRQMRGIQAPDRTAADDADSLDQIVSIRVNSEELSSGSPSKNSARPFARARSFDANHRRKSARVRPL